jgi:hypothetical protein
LGTPIFIDHFQTQFVKAPARAGFSKVSVLSLSSLLFFADRRSDVAYKDGRCGTKRDFLPLEKCEAESDGSMSRK